MWNLTRSTYLLLAGLLREDRSVTTVVRDIAQASGRRIDSAYVDALCATLAQFLEVGIIVGAR